MKIPYCEWSEERKETHRACVRRWRELNPEKFRASSDLQNARRRKRYAEDPEYKRKLFAGRDRERERSYSREAHARRRLAVFRHYGTECACCGVSNWEFLTIDHVNGGGNKHRREIGVHSGDAFYVWLIKNNYPEGFRTLCMNCNTSYGFHGYCPHNTTLLDAVQSNVKTVGDNMPSIQ